jgi:hypothetical protein
MTGAAVGGGGEVTGYAVGRPSHTARDGGVVWYGGGKLAADLTLPKLRARWAGSAAGGVPFLGAGVPAAAVRGALRTMITQAAELTRASPGAAVTVTSYGTPPG